MVLFNNLAFPYKPFQNCNLTKIVIVTKRHYKWERPPRCMLTISLPVATVHSTKKAGSLIVGVCVFGGWLNWPHLAQLESGGVGLRTCGALAASVNHKLSQPPAHTLREH